MNEGMQMIEALPVHGPGPEHVANEVLIIGRSGTPRLLTLEDLRALEQPAALTEDFVCREGWCVPGLHWEGVMLARLLELVGGGDAAHVEVASGGFATQLSGDEARSALLATHLGGEPIARPHGGPLRLIVPGADCYTSVKWVERVEVLDAPREHTARTIALGRLERAAEQRAASTATT